MSSNSKTPPMMESCSITSMHITTLGRPENGAEISFQSTFKGMEANGKPWGIEVTVKLRGADDTLYDIAATAQADSRPKVPVKTERRRRTMRSLSDRRSWLQSSVAVSV